ncbi:MAG: hypothetical protein H0U74_00490 [Bradymonadaceae bacterium]|nr:hypothetical protein [Lujinxingiaceae bacterium]
MNNLLKSGLNELSRLGRKAAAEATSESSIRALRHAITRGRTSAGDTASVVVQSQTVQKAAVVARVAISSGPVREVALICGRAGVAGAVVDGAMGGVQAFKFMRDGKIDGKQAAMHVGAEAGCGFITSSAGTAGTLAAYMITGTMGPAALAAGMGASLGSRFIYRKIIGETLPEPEAATKEKSKDDADLMEDIGPKPQ